MTFQNENWGLGFQEEGKRPTGNASMEELKKYLPYMNQVIPEILKKSEDPQIEFELNDEFVLQVLQDILYGIENEDSVFLQDVLQNGLMEIYKYTLSELEDGNIYE